MAEKQYWKGIAELENTGAHQAAVADEFADSKLPLADLSTSLLEATTPRRDFLKYVGFSTAAATLAAACEMPVRKAIPYAIKPENITPGVAEYYASTFCDGGDAVPVVVKTRDGRPIKVDGNEMSSLTRGASSARVQASVLNLYDKARLRHPMAGGKETTFAAIDQAVRAGMGNGAAVLLTSTITSPTLLQVIQNFVGQTGARHIQWDPVSYSALLAANQASYGRRIIPGYRFDRAATIFGLGADFLGTWLSPVAFAKQYGMGRKVSAARPQMSRHYQVESLHTITGAAADRRATCRPSEMGAVAVALYNAISGGAQPQFKSAALNKLIVQAATDLRAGNGLVVCGSNDVATQTLVNAINNAIGANGRTIDWTAADLSRQGDDTAMQSLMASMQAGQVGTLMMAGVNPVYEHPMGAQFAQALGKVPTTVSFAGMMDETAQKCKYIVPEHHWLESWGDAEPRAGYFSLMQPTIAPLFKTRGLADSLMAFAGITGTYADFWKSYWIGKAGGQAGFDRALQAGVIEPGGNRGGMTDMMIAEGSGRTDTTNGAPMMAAAPQAGGGTLGAASFNAAALGGAVGQIGAKQPSGKPEVIVYEKVSIGHGGQWSNNPWLQEMPDPITKATWDNYACVSPAMAKTLDAELTGINEVEVDKKVLSIKYGGVELKLPIVVVPGMNNNTVGIALGYGRNEKVGRAAANTGQNAYPLRVWNGSAYDCVNLTATVERVNDTYPVAITQTHHSYEGRPIIRELTLASFAKDPAQIFRAREEEIGHYAHNPWETGHGEGHGTEGGAHGEAHGTPTGGGHSAPAQEAHRTEGDHGTNVTGAGTHGTDALSTLGAMAALPKEHFEGNNPGTPAASQLEEGFRENGTLYPNYISPGIHWGMSIDLNSCIGCGACVIGCQAENNISVVGKHHVSLAQEMHWMRIDRYFSGSVDDPDTIQTVFQPMLCQHCDNAPCENVCPVAATPHSSEGLNMMTYNRCIGTKYCANNCPYKVRHFNWMDWNGADCFDDNLYEDGRRDDINDDLTRMVLNPDVTVRTRGVMEKCTFCVQRLQEAKLAAKKEGRPVKDGEARTACQQACPTDAILFGNVNDKTSNIYKLRTQEQKERMYYVLEQIHTLPNINYLAKVRNTDEIIAAGPKDTIFEQHI